MGIALTGFSQKNVKFSPEDSAHFAAYEDTIGFYLDSMVHCAKMEDRVAYNYGVIPRLVRSLKHPKSFHYTYDSCQQIIIRYAPDNSFRTITWRLELDKKNYRHFGAIQMNNGDELELHPLSDASDAIQNPEMAILPDTLWYGMIYYNIIKRKHDGETYYFMFGYDDNDLLSTLKFVDVLTFDAGKPQFGAQVFEVMVSGVPTMASRFMLEYSNSATVTLNYFDDFGKIIYDHVVPSDPNSVGVYFTYLPDGTYEGFEWKDGKWKYIEKVFHETQDTPPFPFPVDFDGEQQEEMD